MDAGVALSDGLLAAAPGLQRQALEAALAARQRLQVSGTITRPLLTVIDYSMPSTEKRLWVLDLSSRRLVFHERVAHGKNTGEDVASLFSNEDGSLMTSLGAFVTADTYRGGNGYSLRLRGTDRGRNDRAEARAIVMHGAPYVDEAFVRRIGRLGRSHGCPAVRPEVARSLIDTIKAGTVLFAWHPSLPPAPGPGLVAGAMHARP